MPLRTVTNWVIYVWLQYTAGRIRQIYHVQICIYVYIVYTRIVESSWIIRGHGIKREKGEREREREREKKREKEKKRKKKT